MCLLFNFRPSTTGAAVGGGTRSQDSGAVDGGIYQAIEISAQAQLQGIDSRSATTATTSSASTLYDKNQGFARPTTLASAPPGPRQRLLKSGASPDGYTDYTLTSNLASISSSTFSDFHRLIMTKMAG